MTAFPIDLNLVRGSSSARKQNNAYNDGYDDHDAQSLEVALNRRNPLNEAVPCPGFHAIEDCREFLLCHWINDRFYSKSPEVTTITITSVAHLTKILKKRQ